MADLKVRITGTINKQTTVTEINTALKSIESKINKLNIKVSIDQNVITDLKNVVKQLERVANSSQVRNLQNVSQQMNQIGNNARQAGHHVVGLGEQLRTALVRGSIWSVTLGSMYGLINGFKEMTNQVIALDSQMTSLRRVMDLPDYKFNELLQESINLGDELSNKISDILDMYGGFGRMGYNEDQLTAVSKTAQILQNVSDLTPEDTVNTLTAAMLNFNIAAEDSAQIADKLNEVD